MTSIDTTPQADASAPPRPGRARRYVAYALVIWAVLFGLFEVRARVAMSRSPLAVEHPELGWVHNTGYEGPAQTVNHCGETVDRPAIDHPLLVRRPPPGRDGAKVLFIGDSFTDVTHISKGRSFVDVFDEATGGRLRVFAAGVSGYGSVQQQLMLARVAGEVKPDLVVWQVLDNDISHDNVFELDSASAARAPECPRPYLDLETGDIALRDPSVALFRVCASCRKFFMLLYRAEAAARVAFVRRLDGLAGWDPAELEALRAAGVAVLQRSLHRAMAEHPRARFVGFAGLARYEDELRGAFEAAGVPFLAGVPAEVEAAGDIDCRPGDLHWNHKGHRVAGEVLARRLAPLLDGLPSAAGRPSNGRRAR